MASINEIYDVAIVGGGLAGLTLSCLLGGSGLKVLCLDQADPRTQIQADTRTTAVSFGSRAVLEEAGVWPLIKEACPIEDIHILDGDSPLLLDFLSEEVEGKNFGWIVDNADLRTALTQRVADLKSVSHKAPARLTGFCDEGDFVTCMLEGPESVKAKLVVGADGRHSLTREWMGVHTRQWSYHQRAVICMVSHENPHQNVAVEHFWPAGPFAILPMTDKEGTHRSSVVFTEHGPQSKSLMRLGEEAFEAALATRFPDCYGDVKILGRRACYPLGLVHAARYIGPRMVLVADAAHGIHPIAGQGLNLGFRDVKILSDLLAAAHREGRDFGESALLETYQRRRRFDNMSMIAVTDGLNRLFSNNIMPVRLLRRAGLRAVSRFRPAKKFFMKRAMGDYL